MNQQSPLRRNARLPWLAAAAAVLVTILQYGLSLMLVLTRSGPEAAGMSQLAMLLLSLTGQFILAGSLAFLIAQWHGERRRELFFGQPWIVVSIFAGVLLLWGVLTTLLYQFVLLDLIASMKSSSMSLIAMTLIDVPLSAFGTWLAWRLATWLRRTDVLPTPPLASQTVRAAGLVGWVLYALLLITVPLLWPTAGTVNPYEPWQWLLIRAGMLVPAILAFIGALIGLPRQLPAVRIARLLAASLVALVCSGLLTVGTGVAAIALLMGGAYGGSDSTVIALLIALGGVLLLGIPALYWLWTRVFYASLRRPAAITQRAAG